MKSLIEGLPPQVAQRIHPDWKKNEADYWAHRDEMLARYRGQWIGFANGRVIVAGTSPVEVLHKAQESGEHPFVTCVGHEHEPSRMRRASFEYLDEALDEAEEAARWMTKQDLRPGRCL